MKYVYCIYIYQYKPHIIKCKDAILWIWKSNTHDANNNNDPDVT